MEVYRRADLLAVADGIIRRIRDAEMDEQLERSVGEGASAAALREEYERTMNEFKASGITITVRALIEDETKALNDRLEAKEFPAEDRPYHEIAIASVTPKLSVEQVKTMGKKIGPQQVDKIWNAIWRATGEQPEVSPAFLPKRSGQDAGQE